MHRLLTLLFLAAAAIPAQAALGGEALGAAHGALTGAGDALISLQRSFPGLYKLVAAFCYTGSLLLIMIGISRLSKVANAGGRGQWSYGQVMGGMLAAAALGYIPEVINTLSCTAGMGAADAHGIMDYAITTGSSQASNYLAAAVDLVRFIGLWSMVSGILALRALVGGTATQDVTWAKVKWKLIGGAACWNIIFVLGVFQTTFGLHFKLVDAIHSTAATATCSAGPTK